MPSASDRNLDFGILLHLLRWLAQRATTSPGEPAPLPTSLSTHAAESWSLCYRFLRRGPKEYVTRMNARGGQAPPQKYRSTSPALPASGSTTQTSNRSLPRYRP